LQAKNPQKDCKKQKSPRNKGGEPRGPLYLPCTIDKSECRFPAGYKEKAACAQSVYRNWTLTKSWFSDARR
jgi:hypothetical protein